MKSSSIPFALLRLLANGRFCSGESLAAVLGCTRSAVWYRIRAVEALGLTVFKVRGRGYRLSAPLDLIDEQELRTGLAARSPGLKLTLMDECESTNAWLFQRAHERPSGSVLICEHQTAGRGRRGNRWTSGVGASLTFSLLWRFACGTSALAGLSLAVAVAVAEAVEECGIRGGRLKWPNDLLHDERKFGGILVEVSGDPQGDASVVIGVGLNVRLPAALTGAVDRPVADLAAMADDGRTGLPSRTQLLLALLPRLANMLQTYERTGFAAFRDAWLSRHAHAGQEVAILRDGKTLSLGVAEGVADDGALLLRTARGVERVHSGEVSLRTGAQRAVGAEPTK